MVLKYNTLKLLSKYELNVVEVKNKKMTNNDSTSDGSNR